MFETEDLEERKKKYISIFEAPVFVIVGGIIGMIAIINAYSRYFIRRYLNV